MNCLWAVAIRPGHRTCTTLLSFTWFDYKPSNKLVLCFLSPPQWWEGNTWRGQLTAVVSLAPAQPPVSRARARGAGPLSPSAAAPAGPSPLTPVSPQRAMAGTTSSGSQPAPRPPAAPHLRCPPPPPSSAIPAGAPARTTSPVVPGGGAAARRGEGAVAEAEPGPARRGRAGPLPPCPGTTWPP